MKNFGAVNQFDILSAGAEFADLFEFELVINKDSGIVCAAALTLDKEFEDGYYIENISLDCREPALNFQAIYVYAENQMVTFTRIDK